MENEIFPSQAFALEPTTPMARSQTSLSEDELLHSTNAGLVIHRTAQLKARHARGGRKRIRQVAERINTSHLGTATVLVYEEAFGVQDRIHWLIHMHSLVDYPAVIGTLHEGEQRGDDEPIFVDGSLHETAMLPQHWKMYGTDAGDRDAPATPPPSRAGLLSLPPAQYQTDLEPAQILNSSNAGILLHRSAQLEYEFRSEGREFAREVVESINASQVGLVTSFVYEEAFGPADRIHWLVHMKSLAVYYSLIAMHVQDETARDIYFRERIAPEKGGGTWGRMIVTGSMADTAMIPLA